MKSKLDAGAGRHALLSIYSTRGERTSISPSLLARMICTLCLLKIPNQ
jgi:hypothetical protein